MQYILLFATVIKCIAPQTFNHIMYNISDFLLVPAKIKYTRAAPSYILFLTGTSKKSEMLYIKYSKREGMDRVYPWLTGLLLGNPEEQPCPPEKKLVCLNSFDKIYILSEIGLSKHLGFSQTFRLLKGCPCNWLTISFMASYELSNY